LQLTKQNRRQKFKTILYYLKDKILDEKKPQEIQLLQVERFKKKKKKAEYEERRQKMISDREDKKNGTVSASTKKKK
jgi:hypothetical protein